MKKAVIFLDYNDTFDDIGLDKGKVFICALKRLVRLYNKNIDIVIYCFLLTNVAKELLNVISEKTSVPVAIDITTEIKKTMNVNSCTVTLHNINYIYNNGANVNYDETDIMPPEKQ